MNALAYTGPDAFWNWNPAVSASDGRSEPIAPVSACHDVPEVKFVTLPL
jgi:hypothetical protein